MGVFKLFLFVNVQNLAETGFSDWKPENAALPGRLGILPWTPSAQCSPCLTEPRKKAGLCREVKKNKISSG